MCAFFNKYVYLVLLLVLLHSTTFFKLLHFKFFLECISILIMYVYHCIRIRMRTFIRMHVSMITLECAQFVVKFKCFMVTSKCEYLFVLCVFKNC